MLLSSIDDGYEAGIDEAGRGCLCGRVYAAAVIMPREFNDDTYLQIKDSKKISKKKREMLKDYIEKNAIAFGVGYSEPDEIDEINILQATMKAMHRALDNLKVKPDNILVDGPYFNPYLTDDGWITNQCIKGGDNTYLSIASASILAKVYHDYYINDLCKEDPSLDEKYQWLKNVGYATKTHRDGIAMYGTSKYHRKTFGLCKRYNNNDY